ncbi:putative leucine-rich repeat domain superfamily [Helianthus annuus]|nr:putative leucine-rich repeat domain superfamily [Helianthus annuus]
MNFNFPAKDLSVLCTSRWKLGQNALATASNLQSQKQLYQPTLSDHFRELRMLSLVLGAEITDASVATISKCYSNLDLLDLSGSSISDSGLWMICNMFPETLTRLLFALCPNITSSGIQFSTAPLPLLELNDCGMTICEENSDSELQTSPNSKAHLTYQKLFVKHARL